MESCEASHTCGYRLTITAAFCNGAIGLYWEKRNGSTALRQEKQGPPVYTVFRPCTYPISFVMAQITNEIMIIITMRCGGKTSHLT